MENESEGEPCDWMTVDTETLRITIQQQPGRTDISLPVDENMVVEFMSR
jgi:ribosomal protein S4